MRLLLTPILYVIASVCFAQPGNIGLAVAYVGPQDKPLPCVAYGTEESMAQVVRAAHTEAHCIPLDPIRVFLDSPEFCPALDRLPNHEGVEVLEHFENHVVFVVVSRTSTVLKRVRLEEGLAILDDLSRHAFQLDLERVRARFIRPARLFGLPAPGDDEGYEPRWARLSSAHDRLMLTAIGRAYEQQLLLVHNTFWQALYARCSGAAKKVGLDSFSAIAVINENGVVTEFLPWPDSQNFACFVDGMLHRRYPAPPSAPFYERFRIRLED